MFKSCITTQIFAIMVSEYSHLWLNRAQVVLKHWSAAEICIMSLIEFTRNHNSTVIESWTKTARQNESVIQQ